LKIEILEPIVKYDYGSYNDSVVVHESALFLDYENIHIGMETSFGAVPDVKILVEAIKRNFSQHGNIIVGKAYGDWERFTGVPAALQKEQIEPVYIGAKRQFGQDSAFRQGVAKNAADIQLALDALTLVYTKRSLKNYILISGDYDFVPLVIKLHSHSKKVCVSGISRRTSKELKDLAGQDFVYLDELLGLKPLNTPKIPSVDWFAFVRYISSREQGQMGFLGRKLIAGQIPAEIVGNYTSYEGRMMVLGEAIAAGIINLYHVENPDKPGHPTAAIKLDRTHDFVKSVLGIVL
jgi:uncharacterized LabA/DUF88 family protein